MGGDCYIGLQFVAQFINEEIKPKNLSPLNKVSACASSADSNSAWAKFAKGGLENCQVPAIRSQLIRMYTLCTI